MPDWLDGPYLPFVVWVRVWFGLLLRQHLPKLS